MPVTAMQLKGGGSNTGTGYRAKRSYLNPRTQDKLRSKIPVEAFIKRLESHILDAECLTQNQVHAALKLIDKCLCNAPQVQVITGVNGNPIQFEQVAPSEIARRAVYLLQSGIDYQVESDANSVDSPLDGQNNG